MPMTVKCGMIKRTQGSLPVSNFVKIAQEIRLPVLHCLLGDAFNYGLPYSIWQAVL